MAYAGKLYSLDKDENFNEFLQKLGLPADKEEAIRKFKPTHKLDKEGSDYVLTTTDLRGETKLKFQSGVEFDEKLIENLVAKTTITVEGDVVNQVQKFADGRTITTKREYTASGATVTLNISTWDGTARRYYKAV